MSKVIRKFYDNTYGWIIEKGNDAYKPKYWLFTQAKEKKITDRLLSIGREEWIVPKMLLIDEVKLRVRQTLIFRQNILRKGELSERRLHRLPPQHKNRAISAMSLFTVDMASLESIKFRDNFPEWNRIIKYIATGIPGDLLSDFDAAWLCEFAKNAKSFIDGKLFSRAHIFHQGDSNSSNTLYDKKKWRLGVIDFEDAGFVGLYDAFTILGQDVGRILEEVKDTRFVNKYADVFQSVSAENFEVYKFVQDFYQSGNMFFNARYRDYNKKSHKNNFDELVKCAKIIERNGFIKS